VHKTNKYPTRNYEKANDSALDRYYSENFDEGSQTQTRKKIVKNENLEKGSEVQSSEMIQRLKEKIDDEIKTFANSCDEITNKINDLIKNIDYNSGEGKDQKTIDEESYDESDEEEDKSKKNGSRGNEIKQKFTNYDEKNLFKSLNESFNKIVQNMDNKKLDYLNKKLNS